LHFVLQPCYFYNCVHNEFSLGLQRYVKKSRLPKSVASIL